MQTSKADNYDFFDILLPETGLKQAGIEYAKTLDTKIFTIIAV